MNKLTRNNLQLFCRFCLSALQPSAEEGFNIHLVPNLTKLLTICTTLDVDEDNEIYPKSVCRMCFNKLKDFESFRSMALQSAKVLRNIINAPDICDNAPFSKTRQTKNQYDEDDDDKLLLPELSSSRFCEKSIKVEPIDIEDEALQKNKNFYKPPGEIKNEIDSESEEHSTIYVNELGTHEQSTEDENDVDEEEAETAVSNSSIINISTSSRSLVRKRDRNKKVLKCPDCDKQVYKQIYLDAHIRAVHEGHEKPFLCMQCNKAFTRYNQLHLHTQSHHLKSQKFVCNYEGCDGKFKMLTSLELHQKKVHSADPSPPFSLSLQQVLEMHRAQLSADIIDMEHICQQCSKKYSSRRALTEHLKRHANIKEHTCRVCGVGKVTRTELLTHMRTHQPNAEKFKCHICPQEFNHKNAITRHVRVVHEGLRPFPCSYCTKRFGTRNSKMCHERLHTGERPYACEICNKSFAQSEGLKSHMKNHDKSLRTHVCKFCSQRFITRKNLIDHEERHRGDKPHICEVCSRGFFKRDDMLTHRRTHVECMQIKEVRDGNGRINAVKNKLIADNGSSQSSN